MRTLRDAFDGFARACALAVGSVWAFVLATLGVLVWAALGPPLGFSPVWQLTINTVTTVITFLIVFLIQSTQNSDTRALHTKLDEVILALERADNRGVAVEQAGRDDLERLRARHQDAKQKKEDPD